MNKTKLAILLIVFGVALGVGAAIMFIRQKSDQPKPPADALSSQSAPKSTKLSDKEVANYTVPPTDPKYIAMPTIGLSKTPVVKLGLLKDGTMATPDNIYKAGWYAASSRPGQPGAMFIYGHVSSWTANGSFYNLKKLKPGDSVIVTRGDNKIYNYKVVKMAVYPYKSVSMNTVLAPINAKFPGLNLMTCTGKIIKGTSEFNERLVVYTSLST